MTQEETSLMTIDDTREGYCLIREEAVCISLSMRQEGSSLMTIDGAIDYTWGILAISICQLRIHRGLTTWIVLMCELG